jgi:hypothetical protein
MTRQASWLAVLAVLLLANSTAMGGLTAYWTFDADYSSTVNNATMQGTPVVDATGAGSVGITNVASEHKVGAGGLKIDDNDNKTYYVNVANPIADAASNPTITIVAWYNFTNISGTTSPDLQNHVWESTADYAVSFRIAGSTVTSPKDCEWYFQYSSGSSLNDTSGPVVTPGEWNHVAMVWNPVTQRAKFYHNGELRDFQSVPAGTLLKTMTGFNIGNHRGGLGARNWDGYIDDMAVFDYEPSADAIAGLASGAYTPATIPAGTGTAGIRVADPMWYVNDTIAFNNPSGLAVSPVDGKLYAGRRNTLATDGGVYRIESDGSATPMGAVDRPAAVAIDPDNGNIFVSEDYGPGAVAVSGVIHRIPFGGGTPVAWVSNFDGDTIDDDPVGLVIVPSGFDGGEGSLVHPGDGLSVDRGSGGYEQVWLWSPDAAEGEFALVSDTDLADGAGNVLIDPSDVAVSNSAIYVADMGGSKIYAVDPATGALSELVTSQSVGSPVALAIDPLNGNLVVLSATSLGATAAKVVSIDVDTGEVSLLADTLFQGGADKFGWGNLAFSPDGSRLYVGEQTTGTIYELARVPEPSTATLLLILLVAGLVARWRRR